MICAYCGGEVPSVVEAEISHWDSLCNSECDGVALAEAECHLCGNVFWRKWLDVSYGVRHLKMVSWKKRGNEPALECFRESGGYLAEDDNLLFFCRISQDVVAATLANATTVMEIVDLLCCTPESFHALCVEKALDIFAKSGSFGQTGALLQLAGATRGKPNEVVVDYLIKNAPNRFVAENYLSLLS